VRRRRGIHHDLLTAGFASQAIDLQPRHQLVGAGQGEVEEALDVFVVEVAAARRDLPQGVAVLAAPAVQSRAGGELGGEERAVPGGDGRRLAGKPGTQRIAERVCGIGGDDEDPPAGLGRGKRGRRGAGGLADATLAAEELEFIRPRPRGR